MVLRTQEVSWDDAEERCLAIRRKVFIQEQGIDAAIEIDGQDPKCWHVLTSLDDRDIGTARMKPDGHIGRVAVLRELRGTGAGTALMQQLFAIARAHGLKHVHLSSQDSAIDFYRKLGFIAQGDMFLEANIPHLNMSLAL